jgi:hypothetical protein
MQRLMIVVASVVALGVTSGVASAQTPADSHNCAGETVRALAETGSTFGGNVARQAPVTEFTAGDTPTAVANCGDTPGNPTPPSS